MLHGRDRRALFVVAAWAALVCSVGRVVAGGETGPAQPSAGAAAVAPVQAVPDKFDAADNAWVLTSSALVLMMTAPGLALFYCGLVRKKNVLSVMMQCIFLMCVMTVIWVVYGYSLVFGGDGPWLGDLRYAFLQGAGPVWSGGQAVLPLHPDANIKIPILSHMLFQGMFFIITPGLICGAFAERMKFSAMVAFSVLWSTCIYCPLAHWLWGGGLLCYGARMWPISRPAGPSISPAAP